MTISEGIYKHFKGNKYEVVGVAKHSEDESIMVVYRPLYGDRGLWVRPLGMFMEEVEVEGKMQPRFEFLGRADQ